MQGRKKALAEIQAHLQALMQSRADLESIMETLQIRINALQGDLDQAQDDENTTGGLREREDRKRALAAKYEGRRQVLRARYEECTVKIMECSSPQGMLKFATVFSDSVKSLVAINFRNDAS